MPTFQYKAKTKTGEPVTGSVVAGDRRAALAQLGRLGYFPLTVEAAGTAAATPAAPATPAGEPRRGRLRQRDVLAFTQQLRSLLRSGMQLNQALGTLARRATKPVLRGILEKVRDEIVQGANLSDALAQHPRAFNKLYVNLVRAGEASGALDGVLERLTKHYEQVGEVREKVITALIYPLIVSAVGVATIVFFMTVMVPKFAQMFKEMHRTMPLPTRILIGISDVALTFWWVPVVVLVVAVLAYRRLGQTPEGRLKMDGWKLRLPLVGPVITLGAFAQFARTLATLMENGVPVLPALQIVEETMTNQIIAREIREARARVTDGTSISTPLAKGKIFPPLLIDMLAVGEQSGEVVPALKNIADTYERELDYRLKVFTTALEPILIIGMALVVGGIVLSVLLAVFDITSGIGR
jgi:type II secretory pathway component PulF